jgi:hypothetical protein
VNNFTSNPLVANNTNAIPPINAGASGKPAIPNARHKTDEMAGAAHPPTLPLSQDPSTIVSTLAQDPGELIAPATLKMTDNYGTDLSAHTSESAVKGLLEKRYQQPQKMVPGVAITARFKVHSH